MTGEHCAPGFDWQGPLPDVRPSQTHPHADERQLDTHRWQTADVQISVTALRRYPVKAMGGEPLDLARFDARGLLGDRWYAVEDTEGRFASGKDTRRFRRRDRVFDYGATTDPE